MNAPNVSPARAAANRANSIKSSGPKTPEGKAKSSLNAVTTALTGRTVLLANDDLELYNDHVESYRKKFRPVTEEEYALVQSIADTDWRLHRIPHLLLALYGKAREEFAADFTDLEPAARDIRIELESYLKYEKQIRNLGLQESRLHRRRTADVAELRTMQKERDARRAQELSVASKMYLAAQQDNQEFNPADLGFDISIEDVRCYLNGRRAAAIAREHFSAPSATLQQFSLSPTAA
jgi:hypothetical protein